MNSNVIELKHGRCTTTITATNYHIIRGHTCHILPPSEIDLGLRLADFTGSGGKYLFHRIG